jgi:hypothetical protein
MESPNTVSLARSWTEKGASPAELVRAFRSFNSWAPAFRSASESHEGK